MKFTSAVQEQSFRAVLRALERLGYTRDVLLKEEYPFDDWFLPGNQERVAPAVAFGQTPLAYDSACFAVVVSNGQQGPELVNQYRALGAPLAIEVRPDKVVHWRVSRAMSAGDEQFVIPPDRVEDAFQENAHKWNPESVFRAKNIAATSPRQADFVDLGLIPALEQHVRAKLDPLLREVLHAGKKEYEYRKGGPPDPDKLYRLVFRTLAGKMMSERGVLGFHSANGAPNAPDL